MFDRDGRHAPLTRTGPANRSDVPEYQDSAASTERATTPEVSLLSITNPPPGHPGVIGIKHAERWVRQGRAFFEEGNRLRLIDRHRAALANSMKSRPGTFGYDQVKRFLTSGERRRIPIAQPTERITKMKPIAASARPGLIRFRYAGDTRGPHAIITPSAL